MFDAIDWTTDVLPLIQDQMGSSIIAGAIASVAAISVVALGARALIGVFHRRD